MDALGYIPVKEEMNEKAEKSKCFMLKKPNPMCTNFEYKSLLRKSFVNYLSSICFVTDFLVLPTATLTFNKNIDSAK